MVGGKYVYVPIADGSVKHLLLLAVASAYVQHHLSAAIVSSPEVDQLHTLRGTLTKK